MEWALFIAFVFKTLVGGDSVCFQFDQVEAMMLFGFFRRQFQMNEMFFQRVNVLKIAEKFRKIEVPYIQGIHFSLIKKGALSSYPLNIVVVESNHSRVVFAGDQKTFYISEAMYYNKTIR